MGVSQYREPPKWLVYYYKLLYINVWFGGSRILRNTDSNMFWLLQASTWVSNFLDTHRTLFSYLMVLVTIIVWSENGRSVHSEGMRLSTYSNLKSMTVWIPRRWLLTKHSPTNRIWTFPVASTVILRVQEFGPMAIKLNLGLSITVVLRTQVLTPHQCLLSVYCFPKSPPSPKFLHRLYTPPTSRRLLVICHQLVRSYQYGYPMATCLNKLAEVILEPNDGCISSN